MKAALDLLKTERRARVFFAAHLQSAFGTGAGYVALLLIAYERFHSPWAITGILLAEFLPGMFLGPLVGAAADRWSRKALLVGADLVRAGAFAGLVLVGSFEATVALALLAGAGNAVFSPTIMAALPRFVGERPVSRRDLALQLDQRVRLHGRTRPRSAGVRLCRRRDADGGQRSELPDLLGRTGVPELRRTRLSAAAQRSATGSCEALGAGSVQWPADSGVRSLLFISGVTTITMGMINVAELLLARDALGVGNSQFSMLVAAMGAGVAAGSLAGCSGGSIAKLKRNLLHGILRLWLRGDPGRPRSELRHRACWRSP